MPRSIVSLRRRMFTACLLTLFRRGVAWATLLVLLVSGLSQAQVQHEGTVQLDMESLKTLIRRAVPTANVVPIPSANNAIILTGSVSRTEDSGIILRIAQSLGGVQVIDALRVGGVQQVQLDVVVAALSQPLNPSGGKNKDSFKAILEANQATGEGRDKPGKNWKSVSSDNSTFHFALVDDGRRLLAYLDDLKTKGISKFLCQPSLVTLSGRPATFLVGGDQAVPVVGGIGGAPGVAFEPFGTQLTFLPIVLGNGKIRLEVAPSITALDPTFGVILAGNLVPGRSRTSANTTVELEPGQVLAIGGMSQHMVSPSASWMTLCELPVVGPLFHCWTKTEPEEMLVLVTPHLVDGQESGEAAHALPRQTQPELVPCSAPLSPAPGRTPAPVEAKLDRIEQKLEQIEKQLDGLRKPREENRLRNVDRLLERIEQLEQRLKQVEQQGTPSDPASATPTKESVKPRNQAPSSTDSSRGQLYRDYPTDLKRAFPAVDAAVTEMQLSVLRRNIELAAGKISLEMRRADGTPVKIFLATKGSSNGDDGAGTRIAVLVGAFGDEETSVRILDKIDKVCAAEEMTSPPGVTGAIVGGILGNLVGAATDRPRQGAAIGAGIGGTVGGVNGAAQDRRDRQVTQAAAVEQRGQQELQSFGQVEQEWQARHVVWHELTETPPGSDVWQVVCSVQSQTNPNQVIPFRAVAPGEGGLAAIRTVLAQIDHSPMR